MAVVSTKSSAYAQGPAGATKYVPVDNRFTAGAVRVAAGVVANAAGDSQNSVYLLAKLPSNAVLLPQTTLDLQDLGFAACKLGVTGAITGLLTVADVSALSAVSTPIAIFGAKWNKPLWEACGLSADPGGDLDIIVTCDGGNATGAGTVDFEIWFLSNV
jgi:hypothetical protein